MSGEYGGCNILSTAMDKPLLVLLNDKFYDIAGFASKHPGGEKVLRKVAGEDISQYMSGAERVLKVRHAHSQAAFGILERYSIDQTVEKDPLLDSKNAMLCKVGNLREKYWQWIHQPYDGTLRLFDSSFLESLTRTSWWVVPVIWLPVVIFFSLCGLNILCQQLGLVLGVGCASLCFTGGTFTWTFLEYALHRGIFHWRPNPTSYNQITLHFLLHGLHHKTPMDESRLVFPPAAATIFIAFFYVLYDALMPWPMFCCFAGGQLFGYICYDMVHYYLHHGAPKHYSSMHFRKVYHHNHHFKDFDLAFGISTMIWDYVFNTVGAGPLL